MFSRIFIGVSDFAAAHAFCAPLMKALGLRQHLFDPENTWAAWQLQTGDKPLFIIGKAFNEPPHQAGNGQMTDARDLRQPASLSAAGR